MGESNLKLLESQRDHPSMSWLFSRSKRVCLGGQSIPCSHADLVLFHTTEPHNKMSNRVEQLRGVLQLSTSVWLEVNQFAFPVCGGVTPLALVVSHVLPPHAPAVLAPPMAGHGTNEERT